MSNAENLIIEINEVNDLGVIDLRLLPDNVEAMKAVTKALGFELPTTPRTSATKAGITALWFSVDQWLITMPENKLDAMKAKLEKALKGQFASVVDVSSLRSILALKGDKLREVLAKSSSTNLFTDDYQAGFVRRIAVAEQGAALHVIETKPDVVHLYIFRSYTQYVRQWLNEAAHEDRALAVDLV